MINGGKAEELLALKLQLLIQRSHTILDIGTSQRFAKELKKYETLFEGKNYIAAGYHPENIYGVYNCDIHADIEAIPYDNESMDAIICLEVLEHVKNPFQAAKEIKRVLKKDGTLLLTVPFLTSYHGGNRKLQNGFTHKHKGFSDFWRFTHEGLYLMFHGLSYFEIHPIDGRIELMLKNLGLDRFIHIPFFRTLIDKIDTPRLSHSTSRHLIYATK